MYRPVIPSKARDWWIKKHASVPPIETLEAHIIGGAIIPLWQRFKTHEEARLRVVRVTTDDGQRIVGIRIPPEQVGPIVRALGAGRDLREPEEIFTGVLDEGEEVALVSGLKLCRKVVHREPVIELIGVDPYKFAELRSLSLLNEQIDWRQRFFVPTDEDKGIEILSALLERYPVMVSDEQATANEVWPESEPVPEVQTPKIVDLDEWIVAVSEKTAIDESNGAPVTERSSGPTEPSFTLTAPDVFVPSSRPDRDVSEVQLAFDF